MVGCQMSPLGLPTVGPCSKLLENPRALPDGEHDDLFQGRDATCYLRHRGASQDGGSDSGGQHFVAEIEQLRCVFTKHQRGVGFVELLG
jgi:hypothetical protein